MRYRLDYTISKKVGTLQEEHFQVPPDVSSITVEYDIPLEYRYLIFLCIYDPKGNIRLQKQISYSEEGISISEAPESTTMGAVPGNIYPGEWTVKVNLFNEYIEKVLGEDEYTFSLYISDKKKKIKERIGTVLWTDEKFNYIGYDYNKKYNDSKKWYKGDFHAHTRLSDGFEVIPEIIRKGKLMNLDFYSATEHNVMHTGWEDTDIMIVPGVEVTTVFGHANVFGMKKRLNGLDGVMSAVSEKESIYALKSTLKEARDMDCIISINHPFLYIWKWLYRDLVLSDIDCVEIINDPTYEADKNAFAGDANKKAVLLADMLVEDGYGICAVGGSDSHNAIDNYYEGACEPSVAGDPATYVYMDGLSVNNLLSAVRKRNVYVCRHCRVNTDILFGRTLDEDEKILRFNLSIESEKKPVIFYIKNGVKNIVPIYESDKGIYTADGEIEFDGGIYTWVRFGAETEYGEFLFYGNAVTKGNTAHRYRSFGDIEKELNIRYQK